MIVINIFTSPTSSCTNINPFWKYFSCNIININWL